MPSDLVVVCLPIDGTVSVAPCSDLGGVAYSPGVVTRPQITAAHVAVLEGDANPFDAVEAGGFFAFAVVTILTAYLVAWAVARVTSSVDKI